MDPNILVPIVVIGASLLILIGVALMARRATIRALLWWVGLACVPVGAYLAGMAPYLIDGWNRLVVWWQTIMSVQPMPAGVVSGLTVLGVGIALLVGSRIVPYRKRPKPTPKPKTTPRPPTPRASSVPTPSDMTP